MQTRREVANSISRRSRITLEQAKLYLGYPATSSPRDGTFGESAVRVGEYMRPGTQLMTSVPMDAKPGAAAIGD